MNDYVHMLANMMSRTRMQSLLSERRRAVKGGSLAGGVSDRLTVTPGGLLVLATSTLRQLSRNN